MGIRAYALVGFCIISVMFTQYAFALEQACPDCEAEGTASSNSGLDLPITVSTDKSTYDHSSTIFVNGKVANPESGTSVHLTVISPSNNIVTIDVLSVDTYGNFNTLLSTAGNLWKYDGIYTIRVQYGGEAVNNKVFVELTGGIILESTISEPTQPIFAEKQIEVITEFDKETEQMILTLKGTDFYPDLKILWVVIHDIGIDFTIANGNTNSDAQGNFLDSTNVKPLAESGNYIIRVIDVERHEFKERLELNNFPDNAISWTLTPKNFKVGESTVIDIKGTVNVNTDYNQYITIRVDQPDHQWSPVAERISLTGDNEFHIAKKVNFRVPGEHLVIIEYNGLVRQSSFTVFTEESKLESEPTPSLQSQELESTKEPVPETIVEPEKLKIAPFVDLNKDPQYYIDRYNNEPSYKKWFHDNYPQYDSIEQAVGLELTQKIPAWVKNIFLWYGQDQIGEEELLNAIKYLINEKILVVN
ncbi:MAG: hypothetical protein IIA83_10445 [Thaumarchaeota archaeon]|nr:hypothetical protein [Nitrososphaerota archaeon]